MSLDYIKCARQTIQDIQYITIATVCTHINNLPINQPWNSPVFAAFDSDYNFYWISDHNSQHSRNIQANPHVFLTIYNSTIPEGTGRGVYIQARANELADLNTITNAVQLIATRAGKTAHTPEQFLHDMPRRIYQAVPEKAWVNETEERSGHLIDIRIEIDLVMLRS